MLQKFKIGSCREMANRHSELPFKRPSPQLEAESKFVEQKVVDRWTESFPRTGCALVRGVDGSTKGRFRG